MTFTKWLETLESNSLTYSSAHELPADELALGTVIQQGIGPKYVLTEVPVKFLQYSEKDPLERLDGESTVKNFSAAMKANNNFPAPLVHINRAGKYKVYDGHRRVAAARMSKRLTMRVWLADDR